MSSLTINNDKCTGCKACEYACSFHHLRAFNPKLASLRVHRAEEEGKMTVLFYDSLDKEERAERLACNQCAGEAEPLCVRFCAPGAITIA